MKRFLITVSLVISFLISACGKQINDPIAFVAKDINDLQNDLGFSADEYNWKYDFKSTDEDIIERSDAILSGNIYVDTSIIDPYPCDIDNIDWDVVFSDSPGTFSLYLLALNPISYLTQAYYLTDDSSYLGVAKNILEQWVVYESSKESQDNPYLWYDHGTAIRSNNIIYFLLAYIDQQAEKVDPDFCDSMLNILEEHGGHLSNVDEYYRNHNHGIFQDQALIYLSYFLNSQQSDEWLALAKERVKEQEAYAFSEEMVHVENSPAYQMGVVELFYQIAEFLSSQGDSFGSDLYDDVMLSLDFMSWAIKPNGILAEIGDTSSQKGTLKKTDYSMEKYGNSYLSYAATLGDIGEKPEELSAWYPKSGYYFGRSSWGEDTTEYTDSTWTMFKAGYLSRTHKHADDISFMLYSKGYDILVDPGWYNYMTGNKYRDYFISSHAHNTVIVDEKSYSPTVENSSKTGFFSHCTSENWDETIAYNDMYSDVSIDRHFIYGGGDTVILIDDIKSPSSHKYTQLFQLSEYMTVESHTDTQIVASIGDSGYRLRIQQFSSAPSLEIVNGESSDSSYGYLSRTMNDVENINTLKWNAAGSDVVFVTVLTIEDSNGQALLGKRGSICDTSKITYDSVSQTISFPTAEKNIEYTWTSRERPAFDYIDIDIDQDEVTMTNNFSSENWNYAWYLTNMETAEVVERISYSEENTARFQLQEDGIYLIKAYMSSKNGTQRSNSIVSALEKNGNSVTEVTDSYPYLNLEYNGHNIAQLDQNTYRFTVDFNYSWNFSIAWYIYKDGGIYFSENTSNTNQREYTFTEPGSYTVMYYLKTPNGDNEFWNFPAIIIE